MLLSPAHFYLCYSKESMFSTINHQGSFSNKSHGPVQQVLGGSSMEAQEAGLASSQHQNFFKSIPRAKGHQDHHATQLLLCGFLHFVHCYFLPKDGIQGWLNILLGPNYCVS